MPSQASWPLLCQLIFCCSLQSCGQAPASLAAPKEGPRPAAERTQLYAPSLRGKSVALVVNHTSMVGGRHLADTLLALGVGVKCLFAPEHGIRGTAGAGEKLRDGRDPATGLPVFSLYGKNKKPTAEQLAGVDLVVLDIQDVGVRFYTYISTLTYTMEACAELEIPLWVLDRPNPNGHYVDGPVLRPECRSFVGMHPVPIVYGLTIGEYARMVNGEGWLEGGRRCSLEVVPCAGYTHETPYSPPVPPSPNLPDLRSIYLYPSICLFEGTEVSEGRGTDKPFQCFGHPDFPPGRGTVAFVPSSRPAAKDPKWRDRTCIGFDLSGEDPGKWREKRKLDLSHLLAFYRGLPDKAEFFRKDGFFDLLAGNRLLARQIADGLDEESIRKTWEDDLAAYRAIRKKYLIYPLR